MDKTLEMLRELTDAPGVSGYEREVAQIVRRHLDGYADIGQDNLGSIICRKQGASAEPKIMLSGHMDEVGFMVTVITKEGFLKFQQVGGWWEQVMLAQRVIVKTSKGDIPGVIGSKPPHILPPEERKKMVEKKDMFIDIGASDEQEARESFGVRPGDPVIPDSGFRVMANPKLLMAKAWDCRAGVAMFIDVIKRLAGEGHPNTVYGVGSVQEEVGLRGATTSANYISPDIGFAVEVDIAGDTPGIKEEEAPAKLGKGPSILLYDASMIPHIKLRDFVIEAARQEGIPLQLTAMAGGGTDAGRIHIQGRGVPSLVIGVPTRYIHSHQGIIHRDDYENAVKLLIAVVKRLDARTVQEIKGF